MAASARDECRRDVGASGLTPVAVTHLTRDALATIEEALQVNEHRPEGLTTRGELWLKTGQPELAEADFHESIALAQKMRAKGWELRATTSLARLLDKQGRRDEARAMLVEIYGWFT